MPAAELTTTQLVSLVGGAGAAAIALLGVVATLWINGSRTERQRRRDLHARALAAIMAYGEMPYRIRRRAPGPDSRATLSDDLSKVKAEVDVCQVLLAADGNEKLSDAFDELYSVSRETVGKAAHDAWEKPVLECDEAMNMGPLFRQLAPFNLARDQFANDLRRATLPRRKRLWRWTRKTTPGLRTPTADHERRRPTPQDAAGDDEPPNPDTPTPNDGHDDGA
jgi:hypothetical protein